VAALRDGADVVAFLDAEDLEAARRLPEILAPLRSGGADLVRDAGGRACGATARLLRSIAFLRADDGRAFDEEVTAAAVARGGRIADVGVGAGGNQTGAEQRLHGLRRELAGRLGHDALTTRRPASPI
jgi:hypothetical protein